MPDLAVTLSNGSTTYALKAESAQVQIRRAPLQVPLPGGNNPFIIDLNQFTPTESVSGQVDTTSSSDGANTVPSKRNLEDTLTESAWINASTITLTINGDSYIGRIADVQFKVDGATENRWGFTLNFLSNKRS